MIDLERRYEGSNPAFSANKPSYPDRLRPTKTHVKPGVRPDPSKPYPLISIGPHWPQL